MTRLFLNEILLSTWEQKNMLALCKCMFIIIAAFKTMTDTVQRVLQNNLNVQLYSCKC